MPSDEPLDLLRELEDVLRLCVLIAKEAHGTGDGRLALNAAGRVSSLAQVAAQLRGELMPAGGTTINVHTAPEFHALQQQLLELLAPHPELRAQVARGLLQAGSTDPATGARG